MPDWVGNLFLTSGTGISLTKPDTVGHGGTTIAASGNAFNRWSSATTYVAAELVFDRGGIWYCVTGNSNSRPLTTNANWTLVGGTPYIAMQFTTTTHYTVDFNPATGLWAASSTPVANGIRTLASLPVDLLAAPGASVFYIPLYAIFLFATATPAVAFSGSVTPTLYTPANFGTPIGTGILFDGTIQEGGIDDQTTIAWSTNAGGRQFLSNASPTILNQPLQVKSGADRTLGGGTLTVILTYMPYNAIGLI